jgi:hypothetical protein
VVVVTLTEFLLARIAEDEAMARAAVGEHRSEAWHLGDYDETVLCFPPSSAEKIAWNLENFGPERAAEHERWGGFTTDPDTAPHIVRHDPARTLAECEAKWAIVAAAEEFGMWRGGMADVVLCELATVYADHPDYQNEWLP